MREPRAKTLPKATHEIKVIRADGSEETQIRTLSVEETETLIEMMRRDPEARKFIDERMNEVKTKEDGDGTAG